MKFKNVAEKFGRGATKVWWLILVYLSLASIVDVGYAPVFAFSGAVRVIFLLSVSVLKASALLFVFIWAWSWRPLRAFVVAVGVFFAAGAIVNAGSWYFYEFGISRKLINLVAQTNRQEVAELIPDVLFKAKECLMRWQTWAAIAAVAASFAIVIRLPKKIFRTISAGLSAVGLVMATWFAFRFTTGRTALLISARIPKYAYDMVQSNRVVQSYIDNIAPLPDAESISSDHLAANVIMIIGESANRDYLSLYGYPLRTSPQMDARADSILAFTDAISSSVYTLPNLENIMSFRPDDAQEAKWNEFPRVIDLFNAAGYRTYWLSNQERAGWWANSMGALSATADVVRFVGLEYPEDAMLANTTYDDSLLPAAREALTDSATNRLIVMHLMGSHYIYNERYPANRSKFNADSVLAKVSRPWLNREKAQIVAEYANSIAYTDSIWGEVARMVETSSRPTVLIYLSDHGENVFDDRDFRGRDEAHVRIPFVMYANAAYCTANPQIMQEINREGSLNRPFSSAAIVNVLMTLTGTRYALYSAETDPLSPEFRARVRYVDDEPWKFDNIQE